MNRFILSFSIYGNDPIYTYGIVENAKLVPIIYPGWKMFVYHGVEVNPAVISLLKTLGCETRVMSHMYGTPPAPLVGRVSVFGKFWRFFAIAEPGVERVMFRDCDSRINVRERAAAWAWVQSGLILHTMKDHINHDRFPILAGMWGIKGAAVDIISLLSKWSYSGDWYDDQTFLANTIWTFVKHSHIGHGGGQWHVGRIPFPPHEPFVGFVGQRVTHDNKLMYE